MAQNPDGSGKGPVQITKGTTSVTSGPAVTQKLVSAAIAFGNVLRGTFGPNGLDKMLYKTNGETAVTNDGAKIIAELMVKHPAAKAFVSLAESQENACGDGVTGCIILASELMSEAGRLLERGIHPLVVVKGYQMALKATIEILDQRALNAEGRLEHVARTALVGRSTEGALDHLASLVAEAVSIIPDNDYESVRMVKDGRGTPSSSSIVKGLIIEKPLPIDRMAREITGAKIATLTCPLEIEKTTRDAEIEISTAQQLEAFIDAEEAQIDSKANAVIASGAQVVFCSEGIDSRILHSFADNGMIAFAGLGASITEDIAQTCDSKLCDHIDDISDSLGWAESVNQIRFEGPEGPKERLVIEVGDRAGLVTILVGGSDGVAAEETIRGLYDSLRSTCLAKEDDSVALGGGSLHMAASLEVRKRSEHCAGRERLSMEAFSRALEAIPAALATNTGRDRIDSLLELRSLHGSGESDAGITRTGSPGIIVDAYVPTYTFEHAISAATESACGLLRVDQVISARGD
tara:strand:+ start:381 stop:1943 length:1563 start_codon:yes stop_codon:yes gene_type:complete